MAFRRRRYAGVFRRAAKIDTPRQLADAAMILPAACRAMLCHARPDVTPLLLL